jgi:four helix bundle protein
VTSRPWQVAMDAVMKTYALTTGFPKSETYGLSGQMRRAAVSVPSNIAEGQARRATGAFLNHLGIALGSLAELDTQLEVSFRLGYASFTNEGLQGVHRIGEAADPWSAPVATEAPHGHRCHVGRLGHPSVPPLCVTTDNRQPTTDYQPTAYRLPTTDYQLPTTDYQRPTTDLLSAPASC